MSMCLLDSPSSRSWGIQAPNVPNWISHTRPTPALLISVNGTTTNLFLTTTLPPTPTYVDLSHINT